MKVLFLTDDLYPFLNPSSDIAYRLADWINQKGINVSIVGFNRTDRIYSTENPYGLDVIRLESITREERMNRIYCGGFFQKIIGYIKYPDVFLQKVIRFLKHDTFETAKIRAYAKVINRKATSIQVDCIVSFFQPQHTVLSLQYLKKKIPFIIYYLDPGFSNVNYNNHPLFSKLLLKMDYKADALIMTKINKEDYVKFCYKDLLHKITCADFPNIMDIQHGTRIIPHGSVTNCCFIGTLYQDIRNPQYTFSLFNQLNKENIVLHIWGAQYGKCFDVDELPANVIYHGSVPSDEAMQLILSADILVNIGNTVLNQMPSKILTYISTGKPIINIIKSADCPTLRYTGKYPLAIDILESKEVMSNDVERVYSFIMNNVGKQIPFSKIEKIYETCTIEFVGKQFYDVICRVVKENIKEKEHNGGEI